MKVYIVEDAPQTRRDIADALAPMKDIEVFGEAESVRDEAVEFLQGLLPGPEVQTGKHVSYATNNRKKEMLCV